MAEEPIIIRMNIAHYREMLKLDLDAEKRATVEGLLTRARFDLCAGTAPRKP